MTAPHITDQFQAQQLKRYKKSLMMTLKKCRNV